MKKFLLVGRTGVGKSSFINTTFGCNVAATSEFEACTKVVQYHANNTQWGDVCLIDTPGLAEDTMDIDIAYLKMVKREVNFNELQASLYVTRLDDTRFRPDEKRTLQLLTTHLSSSIWDRSILVLTFAASLPYQKRNDAISIRISSIENYLEQITKLEPNSKFRSFKDCWLTDNVVTNWTTEGVTALSLLTKL